MTGIKLRDTEVRWIMVLYLHDCSTIGILFGVVSRFCVLPLPNEQEDCLTPSMLHSMPERSTKPVRRMFLALSRYQSPIFGSMSGVCLAAPVCLTPLD